MNEQDFTGKILAVLVDLWLLFTFHSSLFQTGLFIALLSFLLHCMLAIKEALNLSSVYIALDQELGT